MQVGQKRWTVYGLVAMLMISMALSMLGCSDDDDFEGVEPDQLENRTFTFPNGEVFGFPDQTVTLQVGELSGRNDSFVASVLLTTPAGTANGELAVDEDDVLDDGLDLSPESVCSITILSTNIPQYLVGETLQFRPCDIDDDTGALRLVDEDDDEESISLPLE